MILGCIKCGRDTVSDQVFCPDCLAEMKKYPVRPGTVVQLPSRKAAPTGKKQQSKKRVIPLEDQVKTLKKRCWTFFILMILFAALSAALAFPAAEHIWGNNRKIGQNYTTVIPTEADHAAE